jgi:dihydrolipoamide dehydrogenase
MANDPIEPAAGRDDVENADLHAEVLVLGSGPGGYTAAFRAADLGKRVVLVERHAALGGVCLNVGCIPSKALLHVAEVISAAAELAPHGVDFGAPTLDFAKLRAHKDGIVAKLTGGLRPRRASAASRSTTPSSPRDPAPPGSPASPTTTRA